MVSLLASITQSWRSVCYFFGSKVAMKFIVGRCGVRSISRYFHLLCLKWEILNSRFTVSPDSDLNKPCQLCRNETIVHVDESTTLLKGLQLCP